MKYPASLKSVFVTLLCLSLLAGSFTNAHAQSPTTIAPVAVAPPPVKKSEAAKRLEAFEIVWTTVKEQFYDPNFGGVDWDNVRARYATRVAEAGSDQELHSLLQEMLNELHQSHFLIIPPEAIPKLPPADDSEEMSEGEENGKDDEALDALNDASYKLTEHLTTGIGIDLRVLDGSAVVTRVEPGSSAARAGLRPGFIIKRASGMSLDLVIEETLRHPMWQTIIRPEMHLVLLAGYINGEAQSPLQLLYLDGHNRPRRIRLTREKLKGEMSPPIGNLPSMFTEFESKRLKNGIGYIRFNAFVPPLMEKLCGAIRTMSDAPGLIIDLRGNQGGLLGMIGGLSGLVDPRQISLGSMQTRTGRSDLYTFPQASAYTGTLVVLVDGSTQSAAEIFAGGMQENNRATIVGERSAGNTLPSVIKQLPTGALFQYGFANYRTPRGIVLEGRGITPDVNVKLSRRSLLLGSDPQLEAAIAQVQRQRAETNAINTRERQRESSLALIGARNVASGVSSGGPVIRVEESDEPIKPPPPVAVPSGKPVEAKTEEQPASDAPAVERILEKYVAARGGRDALEKLSSRVTRGKAEITSMNLNGTVELYEKAPNKAITNINVPGLGLMQRGFDGTKGWWQDSMRGYIRIFGYGLTDMRREANFYKDLKLKELYSQLVFDGTEKINGREAYVLQEMFGGIGAEKLYFDVENGLLLRRDNIYYEDYREVDGVKLPFVIREETSNGFNFIFRITEVKHNVAIDDATFAESPSCFTRAGTN
jgi:carboxyl-terminal processing protease